IISPRSGMLRPASSLSTGRTKSWRLQPSPATGTLFIPPFWRINGGIMEATFISQLSIFVLAIFVGYYVVWSVTPALHTPLMAVTNAISSVIIVGALIAVGPTDVSLSKILGFGAIVLAAINIFGGFTVTHRMLAMYKKKK